MVLKREARYALVERKGGLYLGDQALYQHQKRCASLHERTVPLWNRTFVIGTAASFHRICECRGGESSCSLLTTICRYVKPQRVQIILKWYRAF